MHYVYDFLKATSFGFKKLLEKKIRLTLHEYTPYNIAL